MYKRVLLALDLEGVNNVVGEAYMGLERGTEQWKVAKDQAVLEINAAAEALFDAGAVKVGLWDNHAGGNNVDIEKLDHRIIWVANDHTLPRMSFIDGEYDCICYFGYHAMEGTLSGVLAHTMSSKHVQYYKLNGKYIGEIDMDAYIAASHGVPSRLFVGGNIACAQAAKSVGNIVTVITKQELGRNRAAFRDNEELLLEIKVKIVEAVMTEVTPRKLQFPAKMEKSFKRIEDAEKHLEHLKKCGIDAEFLRDDILGWDAHAVVSNVNDIVEFITCI